MYVLVHGSDKDLKKVREIAKANTSPPRGFNVLPPLKKEHHYAATIAAAALVGLLAYGAVSCPDCLASGAPAQTTKTMIFGGPGHRTYLGCLSCSEVASDSVFNAAGQHGSPVYPDSIWNSVGQFGSSFSPFSACNPEATDPPVIVDQSGNAYGRVTVNQYATGIGAGARLYDWLESTVCAN
jgi:hypothetical protein